ncbi:MAG: glutamyl-tRNA reductase [Firmicutes bacterium HGW-Firmicutes-1]|jgi:glutamyl-tRNA reductase|nr:MAG: glutamyl-tRNA reductase [Firmicutes bacterium HGW-Firmicutes-1]
MHVVLVGISHKQAPIEIRERIAFTLSKRIGAMKELIDQGIEEVVILSTCNRSEVIAATSQPEECIKIIITYLNSYAGADLSPYFIIKEGEAALTHIYEVASGLDSIVIGEDQILGQVKEALERAQEVGSGKKYLSKILREAITFSKFVRSTYAFSENPLSIGSLGVKFLKEQAGSLKEKKVLIIGTGKMGCLVLRYLLEEQVEQIYIANRTHSKMSRILEDHENVSGVAYEDRYGALPEMDIIITGTSSPHIVIKEESMPKLNKPLMILDLAVPRDVDPKVAKADLVKLFTVDNLQNIVDENLQYRYTIAIKIQEQIIGEVAKMSEWLFQSQVDPMIECITAWQKQVINETLEQLSQSRYFEVFEKEYIERLMGTSIKRVMRKTIKQLKTLDQPEQIEEYGKIINHLFN